MRVQNSCEALEQEVLTWKSMVYDICRKIDVLSGQDKDRGFPDLEHIHMLMTEMDERIDIIQKQCLSEAGFDYDDIDITTKSTAFKRSLANCRVDPGEAIQILRPGNFGG